MVESVKFHCAGSGKGDEPLAKVRLPFGFFLAVFRGIDLSERYPRRFVNAVKDSAV